MKQMVGQSDLLAGFVWKSDKEFDMRAPFKLGALRLLKYAHRRMFKTYFHTYLPKEIQMENKTRTRNLSSMTISRHSTRQCAEDSLTFEIERKYTMKLRPSIPLQRGLWFGLERPWQPPTTHP